MARQRFNRLLLALLTMVLIAQQTTAEDRRLQRAEDGVLDPSTVNASAGRHALIIGNDGYQRSPLVNAVNDARAMRETLLGMGFSVEIVTDADYPTFDEAVDLFVERLRPDDVALFYYAGHGAQVEGENYLIPVDFERGRVAKLKYRAVAANLIREDMEKSGARLSILILDACRDNPFSGNRSAGHGLAQMATGIGTFIAFSTAPGQTATDNPTGGNGLFTHHLIHTLETPGWSIDQIFNEVRRKVYEDSGGDQVPWTASSLIGSFYFQPVEKPVLEVGRPRVTVSRRPETGSLAVTVDQRDAHIYLDGERVATSSGAETIRLDDVSIGDHLLRVTKPGHLDVVHRVRVEPEVTLRLQARLSPTSVSERVMAGLEPERADSAPIEIYSGTTLTDFCATLEQVLMACPAQFRDIVVPSRSRTRRFLETTVALPGAWYNKVYRSGSDRFEYLSSFETDLSGRPGRRLEDLVDRVASCVPADAIDWQQRRASHHQLQVGLDRGDCRLDIKINGETVDLEIYSER